MDLWVSNFNRQKFKDYDEFKIRSRKNVPDLNQGQLYFNRHSRDPGYSFYCRCCWLQHFQKNFPKPIHLYKLADRV